jgi:hypothetical protein
VETNARQLEPISSEKNGNPYEWHLMKTIIGDKLYGLAVRPPKAFIRGKWLEVGTYPAKRVKDGFEFQYLDGKTIRHETLIIKSEELVPQQ